MKWLYKRFERWTKPYPDIDHSPIPSGLLGFCRHFTKGFEKPLLLMAVLSAIVAGFEVALFNFVGTLIDWLSVYSKEELLAEKGELLAWIGAFILIGAPLLVGLHSLLSHQSLLGNFPMAIRWQSHQHLLRHGISFYQKDFAGRIATKVMQTSLAVREAVMKLLDVAVYALVYMSAIIVVMGYADWRLMLPMLAWVLAYAAILRWYIPKLKKVSMEQADARSQMTGRIVDTYSNITTVKLFSHTARETAYAKESMDGFLVTVHKQMRLVTGLNFWVEASNYILLFAVASLSIHLWLSDLLGAGAIAVSLALVLRLNGMAHWIMWEVSSLFENIGTVADGMTTLCEPLPDEPLQPQPLAIHHGEIVFDGVGFSYDEQAAVIEEISLRIKGGEKIGLVGRSGAGKSTLVNLLLGFFNLKRGAIRIDDQDIANIVKDDLRQYIGMITQDTSLLHRTIRENILYGRPDATEAQLIAAAKQAHAYDFIIGLVDDQGNTGFDAQVGERGVKLSGGQRQRIAIARVLLKDAPILVMDEATSALDSEIEQAITESLSELMSDKTVIAIAHRLSTIAAMDRLVVMDQGHIVEVGSHHELLAKEGLYYSLWQRQSGGFLTD
ncbi:ABC transporter ATP-binding protein [uncultured Umboniibacter sp.]|uniref:ABC transporter ATP-binding protein n=1 Tax=uncultured Umboniibacter sp. TaxID=1798917 RepID=UPI00262B41FE|nr:ABC transporter ATP-binding protein [uncultured Umboniibacter sp.]